MVNDLFTIFYWWIFLFGLGIIFLPLTFSIFRKFFDRGYSFSKIISILIVGYSLWLLASFQILPFSRQSIWLLLFIFIALIFYFGKKRFSEIKEFLIKNKKILIFEELLFFLALLFWSYVRGFNPAIEGLEKFMDFGFVNSILKDKYFPPLDMWMIGKTINYYYFGHYIAAFLTKLSGLDSAITYNLMIATIFAFSVSLSFSLAGNFIYFWQERKNFKKILLAGILGALLVSLGGNLHPLWWYFTHGFSFENYWYPDATRFVERKFGANDDCIHEFPIYSFVVADLHGHLNNLPFVLLFLALVFAFFAEEKREKFLPILGLTLAVFVMTNTWDFPIYSLFLGCSLTFLFLKEKFKNIKDLFLVFKKTASFLFPVLILALLASLPFLLNFKLVGKGIAINFTRTPLFPHLIVLWGYQFFFGVLFYGFLLFEFLKQKREGFKNTEIFILLLFFVSFILILIPEIIYQKDIYDFPYHRSNTMFKLVYQAFVMLALASSFVVFFFLEKIKSFWVKIDLFLIFAFLLFFVLSYPYFAIKGYYGNIFKIKNYVGLYGLNFLLQNYPDDYKAILWLKENIREKVGVLEAAGDSFTDFNRVSAITGFPTIQGWLVHEWLWRGSFDEVGERAEKVRIIYETADEGEALKILKEYQIQYVLLGAKEKEKYQIKEEKFGKIGNLVFQSGETKIYKINQ